MNALHQAGETLKARTHVKYFGRLGSRSHRGQGGGRFTLLAPTRSGPVRVLRAPRLRVPTACSHCVFPQRVPTAAAVSQRLCPGALSADIPAAFRNRPAPARLPHFSGTVAVRIDFQSQSFAISECQISFTQAAVDGTCLVPQSHRLIGGCVPSRGEPAPLPTSPGPLQSVWVSAEVSSPTVVPPGQPRAGTDSEKCRKWVACQGPLSGISCSLYEESLQEARRNLQH